MNILSNVLLLLFNEIFFSLIFKKLVRVTMLEQTSHQSYILGNSIPLALGVEGKKETSTFLTTDERRTRNDEEGAILSLAVVKRSIE
jgi:hypothetical protein